MVKRQETRCSSRNVIPEHICKFGDCGKKVCSADPDCCLEHHLFFKRLFRDMEELKW